MSQGTAIFCGIALQTLVLVGTAMHVYGGVMRKLGEFETKLEALWQAYLKER